MKKIALFLAVVLLLFSMTACDAVNGLVGQVKDTVSGKSTFKGDKLYAELDYLMSSPDAIERTDLDGKFSFTAMVYSEPETMTFDDDTTEYTYVSAGINRSDDYFLLDISGLTDFNFAPGDRVTVEAAISGTIYWTEDNKQVEKLDLKASSVAAFADEDIAVSGVPKVEVDIETAKGTYEFVGAHKSQGTFGEVIVVYFNYTNTTANDKAPNAGIFTFYHGEDEVEFNSSTIDEVDSGALKCSSGYSFETTYAGKTNLYYLALYVNENAAADDPLYVVLYNDNMTLTNDIEMPVAASLAEMN